MIIKKIKNHRVEISDDGERQLRYLDLDEIADMAYFEKSPGQFVLQLFNKADLYRIGVDFEFGSLSDVIEAYRTLRDIQNSE